MPIRAALVLHGPNLNLLGTREPAVYGHLTLAEVDRIVREHGRRRGVRVECRQSNFEGELIGWLQALEARQCLALGQSHHGRDGLHTEDLSHSGRRVDVHSGQRPLAVVVGGQTRQRIAQLDTCVAAR